MAGFGEAKQFRSDISSEDKQRVAGVGNRRKDRT